MSTNFVSHLLSGNHVHAIYTPLNSPNEMLKKSLYIAWEKFHNASAQCEDFISPRTANCTNEAFPKILGMLVKLPVPVTLQIAVSFILVKCVLFTQYACNTL